MTAAPVFILIGAVVIQSGLRMLDGATWILTHKSDFVSGVRHG